MCVVGMAGEEKDGKKRAHSCSPAWNHSVVSDSAQVHSVYRRNEQNMPILMFILCPRQFPSNRNNNQSIRVIGNFDIHYIPCTLQALFHLILTKITRDRSS